MKREFWFYVRIILAIYALFLFLADTFALAGADSTNSSTRVIQVNQGVTFRPSASMKIGAVTPSGTVSNQIVIGFDGGIIPDTTVGKRRTLGLPTARFEAHLDTANVSVLVPAKIDTSAAFVIGRLNIQASAVDSTKILDASVSIGDQTYKPLVFGLSVTPFAAARRFEWVTLVIRVNNTGGDNKYDITDATQNYSGTSKIHTSGFFTTSGGANAVTSAGTHTGQDAFLDTDDSNFKIKKTSGAAVNTGTLLDLDLGYTNATTTGIRGAIVSTVAADANFTGSPSSIKIGLYNASGAVISPWSLVGSGETFDIKITGVIVQ